MVLNNKHFTINFSLFAKAFVLLCVLNIVACKKDSNITTDPNDQNSVTVKPKVYVAGMIRKPSTQKIEAVLWVDGKLMKLSSDSVWISFAYSVYVSDTDVFVAGFENNGTQYRAVIWKNGIPNYLTDFSSGECSAYAVFVSGKDVFAIGKKSGISKLWKNGVEIDLGDIDLKPYFPQSLFVDGSDIYITGSQKTGAYNTPILWKNGTITKMGIAGSGESAIGVFVKNKDVYVLYGIYLSSLWKNGVVSRLCDSPKMITATSILVNENNDVYVGGSIRDSVVSLMEKGVVSKNSSPITLSTTISNSACLVRSIFEYKGDIYAIGKEFNNSKEFKIWKNGNSLNWFPNPNNGDGEVTSIFVK